MMGAAQSRNTNSSSSGSWPVHLSPVLFPMPGNLIEFGFGQDGRINMLTTFRYFHIGNISFQDSADVGTILAAKGKTCTDPWVVTTNNSNLYQPGDGHRFLASSNRSRYSSSSFWWESMFHKSVASMGFFRSAPIENRQHSTA
jgi:hypothetical protein